MSGWLLLTAILVVAVVILVTAGSFRSALGRGGGTREPAERRREGRGEAGEPTPRAGRPATRHVTRRLGVGPLVVDTEFSSEVFLPPEAAGEGERGAGPGRAAGDGEQAGEGYGSVGPWGRIAFPAWEHPLPWSYDETRLTALVRDPYWLFAYWEITGAAHEAAIDAVGREKWFLARPVIRVHDVTGGGAYDVAVNEDARNWYLNVGQPDRTFYLEIGRITADGRFIMLARSNTVHTPPDSVSWVIDPRWPPLGQGEMFWPEGMPVSPGMAMPSSPGARAGASGDAGGGAGGGARQWAGAASATGTAEGGSRR